MEIKWQKVLRSDSIPNPLHPDRNIITDTSHLHIVTPQKASTVRYHDRPSGSRRILNKETTAHDITAEFRSAASCSGLLPSYQIAIITNIVTALKTGQLVKDAYFTLFEAVGALEVLRSPHV